MRRFKNRRDKKNVILDCISPDGSTAKEILDCLKKKGYRSRNLSVHHLGLFIYYNMHDLVRKVKMRGKGGTYVYFK